MLRVKDYSKSDIKMTTTFSSTHTSAPSRQVTVGVVGVMVGLLWTFEFILVEDVAIKWDPVFSHLRLLLGMLMGVQCFLAEVPFFMVAGEQLKKMRER